MMKRILFIFLPVVLLAVLGFQYRQASQLRSENAQLSRDADEANRMKAALAQFQGQPSAQEQADEIARLREANRDLLKLRNEVHQLRQQTGEFEKLRAENQRLHTLVNSNKNQTAQPSPKRVLIKAADLSNQGFLTPEATAQTFYWAARQADLQTLAACILPERWVVIRQHLPKGSQLAEDFMRITAIEFVARRTIGSGIVQLGIEIHKGQWTQKLAVTLKLVGGEWKLDVKSPYL